MILMIVSVSLVPTAFASNKINISLGNNSNPEVNNDTFVLSTGIAVKLFSGLQLNVKHMLQKQGGEKTEAGEIKISGGNPYRLLYKVSHGFGQSSYYFSSSSTRLQLIKRLENSPMGGFYEYSEDIYGFGVYRQAEFGPGYIWNNNLIYMGARVEKAGSESLALQYLLSVNHHFQYIAGKIQVRLYSGPQYVFDDAVINRPEFGFRLKINGQWLPPGMPQNMQISYKVNGLFIKRSVGVYRRFGVAVGLVYEY